MDDWCDMFKATLDLFRRLNVIKAREKVEVVQKKKKVSSIYLKGFYFQRLLNFDNLFSAIKISIHFICQYKHLILRMLGHQ